MKKKTYIYIYALFIETNIYLVVGVDTFIPSTCFGGYLHFASNDVIDVFIDFYYNILYRFAYSNSFSSYIYPTRSNIKHHCISLTILNIM